MEIATYDTGLTDAQWAYLEPTLPKPVEPGRPLEYSRTHAL